MTDRNREQRPAADHATTLYQFISRLTLTPGSISQTTTANQSTTQRNQHPKGLLHYGKAVFLLFRHECRQEYDAAAVVHNYEERGMRVLLMSPAIDDRFGSGMITSRIGLQRQAIVFDADFDIYSTVREQHREATVHCVLVDEAQFLTAAQVLQLTLVCDRLNIPVLAYGIRTDFRGEPFEGSKYLLAWAEELSEIKTVCPSGKKATMNARLDVDGNRVWEGAQVDVGNHYTALSRKAFQLEKVTPIDYHIPDDETLIAAAESRHAATSSEQVDGHDQPAARRPR